MRYTFAQCKEDLARERGLSQCYWTALSRIARGDAPDAVDSCRDERLSLYGSTAALAGVVVRVLDGTVHCETLDEMIKQYAGLRASMALGGMNNDTYEMVCAMQEALNRLKARRNALLGLK